MALALLIVLPALARDSETETTDSDNLVTLTVSVHDNGVTPATGAAGNAKDTRVLPTGGGTIVWVAASNDAYNQVYVQVASADTELTSPRFPNGVSVTNRATSRALQELKVDTEGEGDTIAPLLVSTLEAHDSEAPMTWADWETYGGALTTPVAASALGLRYTYESVANANLPITTLTGAGSTMSFFVTDSERTFKSDQEKAASVAAQLLTGDPGVGASYTPPASTYFLVASDNDEVRITAAGTYDTGVDDAQGNDIRASFSVSNSATLKVDAKAPSITGTAPASGQTQNQVAATFQATFSDSGSGLRTDAERLDDVEGSTARANDGDGDNITANEPITQRGASDAEGNGAPADIIIRAGGGFDGELAGPGADGTFAQTDNALSAATSAWRKVEDGFRVQFTHNTLLPTRRSEVVNYAFGAVDRVGNFAKKDKQRLIIDTLSPGMRSAQAGVGYTSRADADEEDHDKRHDTPDLSSIKVVFGGGVGDAEETLDSTSVELGDFKVETSDAVNLPIAEVIHQSITSGTGTAKKTTNHIVWLVLADPLGPGARPQVSIVGTILDTAGNRLGAGQGLSSSRRAEDLTRPEFSVSITGSVSDRVGSNGRSNDPIHIRVTATETLQATPDLFLVTFTGGVADDPETEDVDESTPLTVASVREQDLVLASVAGLTNTWEESVDTLGAGLWGVFVKGTDPEDNTGTTKGIAAGEDNEPDIGEVVTKLSAVALFEIDGGLTELTDDSFVLTPSSGAKKTQTANPFIRINFAETAEYNIGGANVQQEVKIDTHGNVTLTKLQIQPEGGEATDLLGTEGRVDSDSFLVSLSDLAVGKYTLIVNGTDDLGNSFLDDETYKFEVTQRAAYKVSLWPGNNLVSLPGDPVDPSIDAVLPASHPATAVLAYSPTDPVGPWLAATREAGGTWSGPLTEIRQGHGYWVDTSAFTPISTRLVERGSGEVPPTFALTQGWNLIGVVAASSDSIGDVTAAEYLASVNWSVAYTYDTSNNSWTKVTSGDKDATLSPGQGVWVWLESADVLAP